MYKAVAIGPEGHIIAFRAIGMGLEPAASPRELEGALGRVLQDPSVGLVIIDEDVARGSLRLVSSLRARATILILPCHMGGYNTSLVETGRMIKKAIGIDILEGI